MVWIMVVALVLGAIGIGWSVVRFQESKPVAKSNAIVTCDDLRDYILGEEELSLPLWKKYHKQVISYSRGLPRAERPAKVKAIAASVTLVLKSDLRIYREMKKLPQCLTSEFRAQINEWTKTTRDMILYLSGEKKIDGEKFNPKDGIWDTTFYDAFYSATDNLEEGLTQI